MHRPRYVRYLYNRWLFLLVGLSGLGNVILLLYRFVVLGFLSHATEHIAAGVFSLITCTFAFAIFVDLSLKNPGIHKP